MRPVQKHEIDLDRFPPRSEIVSLTLGLEGKLRGVFVPADSGAPVVLHLLESGGSATRGNSGLYGYEQFRQLRDRGFASLVIDYRGVGASDGERCVDHLRDDASAMYEEAKRRAGSEDRIVLRSTSLGTLAAASLIESGARPSAWVMISPVRAESVTENVACNRYGKIVSLLANIVFTSASDADLLHAIAIAPCPILLTLGSHDDYVSRRERERIMQAVAIRPENVVRLEPGLDHVDVSFEGYTISRDEDALIHRLFPRAVDREARVARAWKDAESARGDLETETVLGDIVARVDLDPPRLAVDLADAIRADQLAPDSVDAVIAFLAARSPDRVAAFAALPAEVRHSLFDFRDPEGADLDARELVGLARFADFDPGWNSGRRLAQHAAWRINDSRLMQRAFLPRPRGEVRGIESARYAERTIDVWDGVLPNDAPARLAASNSTYRIRAIRRLLYKAALIPDRVVPLAGGGFGVEIYVDGRWQPTWRSSRG